jgi:hypothetical protein
MIIKIEIFTLHVKLNLTKKHTIFFEFLLLKQNSLLV